MLALLALAALSLAHASVQPQQIRLALTAGATSDTAMTVVFATSNLTEPSYIPLVLYGIDDLSNTAECGL